MRRPAESSERVFPSRGAEKWSLLCSVWPVHPLLLLASLPVIPTWVYLNRGYTVWFHNISFAYILTNWEFLRRFLIVQGTGITLGWYAAICNDLLLHGRFCHILYMNMPSAMKSLMIDPSGLVIYNGKSSVLMFISHLLDTLLHPGLVYLLWRYHSLSGRSFGDVLKWDVIIATYLVSRLWNIVHTFHNTGEIRGWYFGYDVYHINDLDSWLPAYIAEGMFYGAMVAYKLAWARNRNTRSVISAEGAGRNGNVFTRCKTP